MNELQVVVEQTPGTVTWNYEELKKSITSALEVYKKMNYDDSNIGQAKKDRAMLNNLSKSVNARKIEIKKKCLEPYELIETQAKELMTIIKEPIDVIDERLTEYETARRRKARDVIRKYMYDSFGGIEQEMADKAMNAIYDDRWENATAKKTEWQTAIDAKADAIRSDLQVIAGIEERFRTYAVIAYKMNLTKKANTAEKNAKDATANSLKSYSTTEQMNSAIKQKADSIETEVSKKVGSTEIISKINQSPESVAINASKISLNGAVTANSNFKINTDGSAETKALKITGGSLEIGGNCEITRKGDVFALSPKFVSGMYLSNEVSIGVELSKKSYSMIMGYVGKDIFVGESASTLRGYGFTANNDIYAYGKLGCMGEKTRIIHTDDGRNAEMYAYETASPTFGDIGTGKIDNDGYCYVYLENDFLATIEKNMKYHVTLTAKGPGELYIESTNENDGYFLVKGTPKLEFYWEVRVRQKGCRDTRIEESNIPEKEDVTAEDQEMINEQIRNQAILLCEMEKDENEVRDEQSNLIERMEELS